MKITRVEAKKARNERIRIIIYCRVSTDDQEDNGTSLHTQAEACRLWAEEKGYIIVEIVMETFSGFKLDERKKFQEVRKRCKNEEADAIVFMNYDRLTRNRIHYMVIQYDAQRYRYELLCVKEQFDENNIYEKMLREIITLFAEFERYKIQERTTIGRKQRAIDGKLMGSGMRKYGWKHAHTETGDGKILTNTHNEIIDKEAEIVHRIDKTYLEGNSMESIAKMLTREGILTTNGNSVWRTDAVRKILTSTEYHGEAYAYVYEHIEGNNGKYIHRLRPAEQRIPYNKGVYPAIRTKETYDAIQTRRLSAHITSSTSSTYNQEVVLKGVLRCKLCGGLLSPTIKRVRGKEYLHFECAYKYPKEGEEKHFINVASNPIEKEISDYVIPLLKNIDTLKQVLQAFIDENSSQESLHSYEHAIEQVKAQQKELSQSLGDITRPNVKVLIIEQIEKLEDDIEKLEQEKVKITGDTGNWETVKRDFEEVIDAITTGELDYEKSDIKEKKRILRVLGIQAIVSTEYDETRKSNRSKVEVCARIGMDDLAVYSRIHRESSYVIKPISKLIQASSYKQAV